MSDRNGGLSEHPKLLQQYELAKQQLSNHIRSWDNLVPKSEIGESGYLAGREHTLFINQPKNN